MGDDALDQLDYYTLLEVADEASVDQIKRAFRKFARRFHPDRVDDEALRERATRIFRRGSEAYQVLTDPDQRAQYDRLLAQGRLRYTEDGRGDDRPAPATTNQAPAVPPTSPVRSAEALAHFRRAVDAAKQQDWRTALAALKEANRIEPGNAFLETRLRQVEAMARGG